MIRWIKNLLRPEPLPDPDAVDMGARASWAEYFDELAIASHEMAQLMRDNADRETMTYKWMEFSDLAETFVMADLRVWGAAANRAAEIRRGGA